MQPLVTVLMPAYNHGKYIQKAIRSILGQTYQSIYIEIVDDCSTDNTLEIARTTMGMRGDASVDFGRSHVGRTKKNEGRGFCRNKLLVEAHSDLVCWMDADDEMHPRKIEKQVQYLQDHPSCWFVGTEMDSILNDNGDTEPGCHPAKDYDLIQKPEDLDCINPFGNPTIMFYKLAALRLGGYNPNLRENEDVDFWKRAVAAGYKIHCLPERLYKHRLGSHS